VIQTRDLRFAYAGHAPLCFRDVVVPQGGTLLLRGASGSGKSTWLALAAGLLTPAAGEVVVAGQSVGVLPPGLRDRWRAQHVGFLPQRLHLSGALTVHDNLALAYFAAGAPVDREAIRDSLAALDLTKLAERRPHQLSGGQAQRVALARAVLMQPRVMLADEPTASLDDAACQAALGLLMQAARAAGATLVIATHDARVRQVMPHAQELSFESLGQEAQA
jgi:putative ABC transport system ATP-binding protein